MCKAVVWAWGPAIVSMFISWSAEAVTTKPWLRIKGQAHNLKASPKKGRFLAFTDETGRDLQVLDIESRRISQVTHHRVGQAFFWSPDGLRLFYRTLSKTKDGQVQSLIKGFDVIKQASIDVASYPGITGILTFDPRDLRMHLMSKKGIHTKKIYFPDQRLARWQVAHRNQTGTWLATDKGIIRATDGGYSTRQLADDGSGLQSFAISPDGTAITWATKAGRVYLSIEGGKPRLLGRGTDPRWHPLKPYVLFAGARMVGDKAVDHDLRIADKTGSSKFLTYTQDAAERWPTWTSDGNTIIYTKSGTTDLYQLKFAEEK